MVGLGRKKPKAKKSINALVLAASALATPAVPSLFAAVKVHLQPRPKASNDNGNGAAGPPTVAPRTLAPARRAQSMSVLPVHVPAALAAAARTQSTTATTTETAARSKNVVMRGEAADGEPQSSVRAEVKDDGKRSQHAPASAIADATEMAASSAATARASAREREQQRQAHASLPPPPRVIPAAIASSTPVIPRAADHGGAADEEEEDVEEADMDFDAEFGFEPVTPNPPPILSLNGALTAPRGPKSKTQAGREAVGGAIPTDADADADAAAATRNISPRRVQSAPTNLLKIYDESLLLEHDDEEDEWFVPSVKAKAERRLGRKGGLVGAAHDNDDDDDEDDAHTFGEKAGRGGLRAVAPAPGENMESWDDDFDADGEDDGDAAGQTLRIPDAVQNLQHQIKGDAVNLKKFALHIEDLKLLNSDAADMAAGVPASSRSRLAAVRARYAADLLKVQVLIALGDYAEDDNDVDGSPASQAPTEQHLQVLVDMMVGGTDRRGAGGKGGGGGGGGGGLPPAAARELERMVRDGTLVFGVELMPALIKHMAPLKLSLSKYVEDVRAVLLTAET